MYNCVSTNNNEFLFITYLFIFLLERTGRLQQIQLFFREALHGEFQVTVESRTAAIILKNTQF